MASEFGLRIGGTWPLDGTRWRVTGLVENPAELADAFALVAPGQVTAPTTVSILLSANLGPGSPNTPDTVQYRPAGTAGFTAGQLTAGGALGLAMLGLVFVGLVALAGFTVMAQRRRRALGMLAAVGATDRNLRLVMLVSGAVAVGRPRGRRRTTAPERGSRAAFAAARRRSAMRCRAISSWIEGECTWPRTSAFAGPPWIVRPAFGPRVGRETLSFKQTNRPSATLTAPLPSISLPWVATGC